MYVASFALASLFLVVLFVRVAQTEDFVVGLLAVAQVTVLVGARPGALVPAARLLPQPAAHELQAVAVDPVREALGDHLGAVAAVLLVADAARELLLRALARDDCGAAPGAGGAVGLAVGGRSGRSGLGGVPAAELRKLSFMSH